MEKIVEFQVNSLNKKKLFYISLTGKIFIELFPLGFRMLYFFELLYNEIFC